MPTENRSSNTEMAAKLNPCPFCGQQDAFVEQLDSDASVVICQGRIDEYSACLARGPVGVQQHECEDQPGRDQAVKEWNKRAAAQNHPEPLAWMVGTAIWWTKEEAERDAAETGLPIVGLGPMTDSAEVERLREALRFYADRDHFAEDIGSDWDSVSGEPANVLWHENEAWFVEDGSIARATLQRRPETKSF
ncbi:Lar family restriction alleviation protein [Pseudomonas putida]|uniref:Lar family restriction alleviation protein n=1 Tax=Pseudomonas TaxID=286 RepID=UPI000AB39D0F|nr:MULTISPECIES: Lar family restriction alleviation protein [Pseudomonas]ULL07807.1 Lar family restriction alleviation protein [Pseudomonas putida]